MGSRSSVGFHDAVIAVHHVVRGGLFLLAFLLSVAVVAAMFWVGSQSMGPAVVHLDGVGGDVWCFWGYCICSFLWNW